jgi:hypothetical protein
MQKSGQAAHTGGRPAYAEGALWKSRIGSAKGRNAEPTFGSRYPMTPSSPPHRMIDQILVAFDLACDEMSLQTAKLLLDAATRTVARSISLGDDHHKRDQAQLVVATERLWAMSQKDDTTD